MGTIATSEITHLLATLSDADRSAAGDLLPLVYEELRSLAGQHLQGERTDHTLQATALVHEAYLRLMQANGRKWNDRAHFYRLASKVMRHILVDYARERKRLKRGGDLQKLPLDEAVAVFEERATDLETLDNALIKLAEKDDRMARVVELRFFGGLTVAETAEALDISDRSVESDWSMAKLWLLRELSKE
jgi:RNA polymerase sigma factor (TIGR02999 family)